MDTFLLRRLQTWDTRLKTKVPIYYLFLRIRSSSKTSLYLKWLLYLRSSWCKLTQEHVSYYCSDMKKAEYINFQIKDIFCSLHLCSYPLVSALFHKINYELPILWALWQSTYDFVMKPSHTLPSFSAQKVDINTDSPPREFSVIVSLCKIQATGQIGRWCRLQCHPYDVDIALRFIFVRLGQRSLSQLAKCPAVIRCKE